MRQQRVSSWWRQWTCVGGTCAPAAAPPSNAFERALDTYTILAAPILRGCILLPILAVVGLASSRLGMPGGLWLAAAFFLVHGGYCLANFARCREAHCVITGWGGSILGIVGAWGALTGHDVLSALWTAYFAVAVIGFAFEAAWKARRGTNAIR